jgi:hypothetical protein
MSQQGWIMKKQYLDLTSIEEYLTNNLASIHVSVVEVANGRFCFVLSAKANKSKLSTLPITVLKPTGSIK